MTDRELMQMALDALMANEYALRETGQRGNGLHIETSEAIAAINKALVQPEPEPVAWMRNDEIKAMVDDEKSAWLEAGQSDIVEDYTVPLYTAPPQREWQGLTDEEIEQIDGVEMRYIGSGDYTIEGEYEFARAIEAKLREKNHG